MTTLVTEDALRRCVDVDKSGLEVISEGGELRHAVESGAVNADRAVELGEIVIGRKRGREHDNQFSVCDLTGVGVQDTAIARWALERAITAKLNQEV